MALTAVSPELKRIPGWGKLAYGAGSTGWNLVDRVVITWLMYFYVSGTQDTSPLLLPAIFGALMLFGRVVDAVADPLIAVWSDNLGSRWGRRTPFLTAGGLLYVVVFVALFLPPVATKSAWNGLYLAIMLGLYFFLFTAYVCPYLALLPELARTERDRVDLATFKAVFTLIGVAVGMVGSGVLIGLLGFRGMVISFAFLALLFLALPLLVREREYADTRPATLRLRPAILTTFRNRAFRIYLVANVTFWFGFNIVSLGVPFYVTTLLELPEEASALYFAAIFVVAALAFPFVNTLAKRWGLKAMMSLSMLSFVLVLPLIAFIGRPVFGLPEQAFALVVLGLAGLPVSGLLVIPDAIVAAVSDLEERLSGQHRQAMYFGTQGVLMKVSIGLSALTTGLLLQLFGQTPEAPLGVQLTGPVAAAFILLGLILFQRYPEYEVRATAPSHATA